jgi:hypothetical protein
MERVPFGARDQACLLGALALVLVDLFWHIATSDLGANEALQLFKVDGV